MTRSWRIPEALPALEGWAAQVYAVAWTVLLAVSLVGIFGGGWRDLREGPGDAYAMHQLGISIESENGATIDRIAGNVARTSGLQVGDRVLAIDGIAIPNGPIGDALSTRIQKRLLDDHAPARLVVQRGQAAPRTVLLPPAEAHGDALYAGTGLTPVSLAWLSALVSMASPLAMVIGAVFLFGRRRDSVAALLSLTLLALTIGDPLAGYFWREDAGAPWVEVILGFLSPFGLLLVITVFPNGRFVPRWTFWLALALPLVLAAVVLVPALSASLYAYALVGMAAMIVRYMRETPVGRRSWRWALIGFAIGIALAFAVGLVLEPWYSRHHTFGFAVWSWIAVPLMETTPSTFMAAGVVLSVLRFRLYDTQAAVSRSVLYGTLTLLLLAIFAGSEKLIEIIGERFFGESIGMFASGLGAAFAAVAISPLHHRIGHWVEHRFRKNLIHLRYDLPPHLVELGETTEPVTVAHAMLDRLAHGLHAARGAIIANGDVLAARDIDPAATPLPQGESGRVGTLALHRRDPLFPVRLPLAADGSRWLLLGPRPDGSLYDRQERELLADLAAPLAQALRISAYRVQHEDAIAARFARVELALQRFMAEPAEPPYRA